MFNKYCILLALLSFMLLAISFLRFDSKDNTLSTSDGILMSYSFGRGGDFSVVLKDQQTSSYKKFNFFQFRSYLDGQIGPYKGKLIRVDHYGEIIANCWYGDKQLCFSKCESDRECRIAQNKSAVILLRSLSAFLAVLTVVISTWLRIKRR